MTRIVHPFEPYVDEASEILILGSFPSVRSRETGFYYGHPQNRFWKILSAIDQEPLLDLDSRKQCLKRHHIALWDVLGSCEITGSDDASIRQETPNDLSVILDRAPIKRILINGKKAAALFHKHGLHVPKIQVIVLPSTSAANAQYALEDLTFWYREALKGQVGTPFDAKPGSGV